MCFARFISVLTGLPPLPLHTLSTPSFLDVRMSPPGLPPMGITVRPWRLVCVTANMQCAVPLSLLFSFLAPPAMLRTDCLLLCTQRGAGAQPRQQDVRASSNCSLESKTSAFSSSPPLLILYSLLLCAVSHSTDAMSMPCHLLQVCVQGAGVGPEREPSKQLAFPAPQTRFLTH